ncbi:MAG: sel1 repeat family protein [Massilia sp.]|nr:sel1 repeat family protein [Massilia sp.]
MMRYWLCAAFLCSMAVSAHASDNAAARAQFELGRDSRNAIGTARDTVRAYALIRAAALGGYGPAMFTLSNMLECGEGIAKDPVQARRWLEAAAAQDYPEALQQLALNLRHGTGGYIGDQARADQLLREAEHAMKHRAHQH